MAGTLFLGVEGSGKTTLAMALARAFSKHAGEGWYLRPVDRGAYSFATIAPEDFARDGFPRQTANLREMSWQIERDGEAKGELRILDYPGEIYRLAFLSPDDEPDPVAFRERLAANEKEVATLREALKAAARVFVLFNLQDALDLRGNDANRGAVWVTNESLKAAKALPDGPKVTLVFTQVDRYQTEDDFLHSFTPADLDLIGHDHPDIDWTMVSVLVPPESEFGVDAFVRRCTGLVDFGVPTGRPVDVAAAHRGESLKRLAEACAPVSVPAPAPAAVAEPMAAEPEKPAAIEPPCEKSSGRTSGLSTLLLALLVVCAVVGGGYLAWQKSSRRPIPATSQKAPEPERRKPAPEPKKAVKPQESAPQEPASRKPATQKSATDVEGDEHPSPESQAVAKRIASAAWAAWVKSEATRLQKDETARARLKEALAKPSPQEAHAALCEAAEAGCAEAQYRLACVYDVWGWGAWVRTKEDRAKGWTEWLRRIDFEKGAKAVPVSRPAPNAEEYRRLALDWYRSAAAHGVAAAEASLKRHVDAAGAQAK